MQYLSAEFFILLVVTFLAFYLVPKKDMLQRYVILCASIVFLCANGISTIIFLLISAVSSFAGAFCMKKSSNKRAVLVLVIAINVLSWMIGKNWSDISFLVLILQNTAGLKLFSRSEGLSRIATVGISYYMLKSISYIADVYCGKIEPEKRFDKYLLYLSYFPAIVQGPIARYDDLMPKLVSEKKYDVENIKKGLTLILFGFVKKLVIADRIDFLVDRCFTNPSVYSGFALLVSAILYAVQIYADFSGCVDICRGVSRLFDIELGENFRRPYLATSITDFWNRWHISLSSWLKDYIYIPLGGNRKGTAYTYLNIVLVFLISGIWHGSGLTFMVWGLLHAAYQIVSRATSRFRDAAYRKVGLRRDLSKIITCRRILTFVFVSFAWIFFRAADMEIAFLYIRKMITNSYLSTDIIHRGLTISQFAVLLLNIIGMFAVEYKTESADCCAERIQKRPWILRMGIYTVLLLDVILFGVYGSGYDISGFLYGGF